LKAYQDLRKEYQKLVAGKISVEQFTKSRDKIFTAMKIKKSDAAAFANKVMQAAEMLVEGYVKPLNQGELVAWAIRGLYKRVEQKNIPEDIKAKLAKAKELKSEELLQLLTDVRHQLGKREDLADDKDVDIALLNMTSHLDPYTTYIDKELLE